MLLWILRKNTGGNSSVANYFEKYFANLENASELSIKVERVVDNEIQTYERKITGKDLKAYMFDKNLFYGKAFILISNLTFSSAILFSSDFSDLGLAKIIGEVPGNSPTHFGDLKSTNFTTLNSKIKFSTTYKKFYRLDSSKDPNRLNPDIQVTAEDAMNRAYAIIKEQNKQY